MSTKFYLAGPMQGIPQFNFPAFDAAAKIMRAQGHEIISPAELDDDATRADALASKDGNPGARTGKDKLSGEHTWGDFLSRDVKIVADQVDGIVVLPNWHKSKGARLEVFVGLLANKVFAVYDEHTEWLRYVSKDYIRGVLKENMP